jgi:hypothetical protein
MRYVLLLAILLTGTAQAAVFAHAVTTENRVLNLHDTKCQKDGWEAELVSATAIIFKGCWAHHPSINDAIHIKWADGDESVVHKSVFKEGPRAGV